MASDFNQTGVLRVNGAWATSIKYDAAALGSDTDTVNLRFMQGRAEIARTAISRAELGALLGEPNRTTIERHLANDTDKYLAVVAGELRGQKLHYREVTLPGVEPNPKENSISATPVRDRSANAKPHQEPDVSQGSSQKDEEPTQSRDSNAPDDAERQRGKDGPGADAREPAAAPVPPHIAAKYLVKGDTYHFDDQTVAFVDRGKSLTVQTHNQAVIQDLVAIAQARDWQAITVMGTEAFRREAWKAAASSGLTVTGYTPSELERMALERERSRREERSAAPAQPRASEPRSPSPSTEPSRGTRQASDGRGEPGVRYGVLVDHGEAPYRHQPEQSASYFVTVKDAKGQERTSWGVGLKDAIETSKTAPAAGDVIGIRRARSEPVTVRQRVVDENGEITTQAIETKRQTWEIEKADYFKSRAGSSPPDQRPSIPAEKSPMTETSNSTGQELGARTLTREQEVAAAIRSASTTREELQLKYPDVNQAVFQHLASHDQFAEAYVRSGLIREADRAQVISQMRERLASQVERGKTIREPDNNQVNTLIRRSVNRVAADIGRLPIKIEARAPAAAAARAAAVREDAQVRG